MEIREIYENHRSRSKSPFVDKSTFCHLIPFNHKTGGYIFSNFAAKNNTLNIFEFLSALILTSYTHYCHKIHCKTILLIILF